MIKIANQCVKAASSEHPGIISIIRGVLLSYLFTIPLFIGFAFILMYVDFPEKLISPAVIVTTIISAVIAGYVSAKGMKNRGWMNGGTAGLCYMIILYLASSVFTGSYKINTQALTMLLTVILSGALGGIIGINIKGHGKQKNRTH